MKPPTPLFVALCFSSTSLAQSFSLPTTFETSTSPSSPPSAIASSLWEYTPSPYWPPWSTASNTWLASTYDLTSDVPTATATETSDCTTESALATSFAMSCASETAESPTSTSTPDFFDEYVCQGNCTSVDALELALCLLYMAVHDPDNWLHCFSNWLGASASAELTQPTQSAQSTPTSAKKCASLPKPDPPPRPKVKKGLKRAVIDGAEVFVDSLGNVVESVGDVIVAGGRLGCAILNRLRRIVERD